MPGWPHLFETRNKRYRWFFAILWIYDLLFLLWTVTLDGYLSETLVWPECPLPYMLPIYLLLSHHKSASESLSQADLP